jgi:hypothetical protein
LILVNVSAGLIPSAEARAMQAGEEAQRDEDVAKAELLVAKSDVEVAKAQLSDTRAQTRRRIAWPAAHAPQAA